MPTEKKKSLKEKSSTARIRGLKQTGAGYGKKTALLEEAITHMNAGKYGRSSAALKELLAMDPHNMEARRLFATLHLRLGSLIPARQAFDSLIDEAFGRQDYWLAESLLREYLAAGPRCVPYLEKLGDIYQDKGETLEAVAEYGKAIDILIEDPEPDDPTHASRIYERIKSLAPASPVAIRLADCFDVRTGELIPRQASAAQLHSPPAEEASAAPVNGEPIAESTTWEEPEASTPTEASAVPVNGEPIAKSTTWEEPEASTPTEASAVPVNVEPVAEPTTWEEPEAATPIETSVLPVNVESIGVAESEGQIDSATPSEVSVESSPIPDMPAEANGHAQPEEDTLEGISVDSGSAISTNGYCAVGCVPEPTLTAPGDIATVVQQELESLDGPSQDGASTGTIDSVSCQTVEESPEAAAFEFPMDQSPGGVSAESPQGREFSLDTVFKNEWEVEEIPPADTPTTETRQSEDMPTTEATSSTIVSAYAQTVERGVNHDVPEDNRPSWEPDTLVASVSGAPMPWEHVQDSTIKIPEARSEETVAELPVEHTVTSSDWVEPVVAHSSEELTHEQERPPEVVPTADGATENTLFSILPSSTAPSTSEVNSAPAGEAQIHLSTEEQAFGAAVERQSAVFSFAGELPTPVDLDAPAPLDPPPEVDESAPLPTECDDSSFSLSRGAVEAAPAPPTSEAEFVAQDLIRQEEWSTPASSEVKAPLSESASPPQAWIKSGQATQVIEDPAARQAADTTPERPRWGEQMGSYSSSTAAAVDVLFEPSGRLKEGEGEAETRERTERLKPKRPGALSRIGSAASNFIGSCFSTTRAIVTSLIALAVLACAVAALGIGAVGLTWIMMEEPPSAAYQRFTAQPQQTLPDPNQNGYLLLLGFDAPSGEDAVQAGVALKSIAKEADRVTACLGDSGDGAKSGQANASAKVLSGWVRGSDPVGHFISNQGTISGWIKQGEPMLARYKRWQRLPFEDRGFGQAVALPCASINFAHHLYVAEGFIQQTDIGVDRLEADMEAWRIVLAQAKTIPVKTLAIQAVRDDAEVASEILARPDFDGKYVGRLSRMLRPLSQAELSIRWPMQSELVWASKAFDGQMKAETEEDQSLYAAVASALPLPKQRRLNGYAAYYEASSKAAEEGRHGALPKRVGFVRYPAETMTDYFTNPIENVIGLEPLPAWDVYNGMAVDADAHLRLASLQAWIRRGLQDAELLPRIAKAGQSFYDPYTGLPMLVNLRKRVLYSVGHDGKDQDGDPQYDVVVSIPAHSASVLSKFSSAASKSD